MTERQARTGRGGTILETFAALVFALALAASGCGGDDGGADAAGGGGGGGDGAGGGDSATPELCTTAAECNDGDECTEDTCSAAGVCAHAAIAGALPTGAPCEKDCDCEGTVCYGEAYLAPNRYCTKRCGGVAEGCGQEGACLNFSGRLATENGLTIDNFCMPRCSTAAECTAINPALVDCPSPNFTEWKGATVGAPTCTIIEEEEE